MSNENKIAGIERNIKEAKAIKELGSVLERLKSNRDFRAVIKEAYFQKEAIRLVHLLGDANFQAPEKRAAVIKQMDALSSLNQFFMNISHQANQADKAIQADEAELEDIRNEGAD